MYDSDRRLDRQFTKFPELVKDAKKIPELHFLKKLCVCVVVIS